MPIVVMLVLFVSASCGGDKKEIVKVVFNPDSSYTMRSTDVSTLISDSGITRYKLVTKEWLVFDKAAEPYWYFPQGIYVEKFDTLFRTEASLRADTAYNYKKKELLKFVGNVKVESLEGKKFDTSILYWDQKNAKFYSDQYIRIEEEDKIITGVGFESNQDMTQYKIFNSAGQFPLNDSPPDSTATVSDTIPHSASTAIVREKR